MSLKAVLAGDEAFTSRRKEPGPLPQQQNAPASPWSERPAMLLNVRGNPLSRFPRIGARSFRQPYLIRVRDGPLHEPQPPIGSVLCRLGL